MPVISPGPGEKKSLAKLKLQAGSNITNTQNYSQTPNPTDSASLKDVSETVVVSVFSDITLADHTLESGEPMAPHLDGVAPHSMDELSSIVEKEQEEGVICTTIYNSMGTQEWYNNRVLWNKHLNNYLTPYHQVGYYKIFKPFTNLMSKNKLIFRLGKYMAKCRTRDIKAVMTNQRRYLPGVIIRCIFEPISFAIGYTITKVKG